MPKGFLSRRGIHFERQQKSRCRVMADVHRALT